MARPKGSGVISVLDRLFGKSEIADGGCWLWNGSQTHNGYGEIRTPDGLKRVHRVSFELFCGPIPEGMKVLHECDVRNCWNPDHLFTGTSKENSEDMVKKGRQRATPQRGESNPNARLTPDLVRAIRNDGRPLKQIADDHAIHFTTVSDIKRRKAWAHIE